MRGILLAGGEGTRLKPLTDTINKHLITIHGKFIIDYSVNSLRSLGCKEIVIVLGGSHFSQIVDHLKGEQNGIRFFYVYQGEAKGISQAINLCKPLIQDNFPVMLGDNIFTQSISLKETKKNCAQIFLADHQDIKRFGVASINKSNKIVKIEEKPKEIDKEYKNLAITGCYYFTPEFFDYFTETKPSNRNEFEIVDIIQKYLDNNKLEYSTVSGLWSDAGVFETINNLNAHYFINQSLKF